MHIWRVCVIALLAWTVIVAAEDEGWNKYIVTSWSVRSPLQGTRVLSDGTVVSNPADWQLAAGVELENKDWKLATEWQRERQNGIYYTDQEYTAGYNPKKHPWAAVGLRIVDSEEADPDLYLVNAHFEYRQGWRKVITIGVGVTRNYAKRWLDDGATLFRSSLNFSPKLWVIYPVIRGEFEVNKKRQRLYGIIDLQGAVFGRFAFIPFAKIEKISRKGFPSISRWQYKLKVSIGV